MRSIKEMNKRLDEREQEIERLCNALNEVIERNSKAIECLKSKFVEQGGFTSYEWNDLLRYLLNILQGSDKE